jgi:hypothetical protein
MVDDGLDFCAIESCCLWYLLRRIIYSSGSDCSIGLSARAGRQLLGHGIDRRWRWNGKTIIPLSTLNLANLARQTIIFFLFIPNLSDHALPVSSIQAMDESRDQVRVFGSFFDGGYGRAELSSLSVLMLIQAVANLVLE